MKHKHYDMIVALAENMKLAVFCKGRFDKEWVDIVSEEMPCFIPDNHYFLCLPQHKDACLHWLNGGGVQYKTNNDWVDASNYIGGWSAENLLMDEDVEFRIKPKKEKRWIAVNGDAIFFANSNEIYPEGYQLMQIEVEV